MKNFSKNLSKKLLLAIILITSIFPYSTFAVPTYYPLPCENHYEKKDNQLFFNCKAVKGVDFKTVEIMDTLYFAKDKNKVFCEGKKIAADPKTFQEITGNKAIGYYKDKKSLFYGCGKLKNGDPKTFENIDTDFNKDKNNTYYQGVILPKVDRKTFKVLGGGYAKDKKTVYFRYSKVKNADVGSFKIKAPSDYNNYCNGAAVDALDIKALYMSGTKVCKRIL